MFSADYNDPQKGSNPTPPSPNPSPTPISGGDVKQAFQGYKVLERLGRTTSTATVSMGRGLFYTAAGESASGLRTASYYKTTFMMFVGDTAINTARKAVNAPLAHQLNKIADPFGGVEDYRASLAKEYRRVGLKPLRGSGTDLKFAAQRQLRILQKEATKKGMTRNLKIAIDATKKYKELGVLTTFAKGARSRRLLSRASRFSGMTLMKMSQADPEAFKGLNMTLQYTRHGIKAGRAFFMAGRKTAIASVRLTGAGIRGSAALAGKLGNAAEKAGMKKVGSALKKYNRGVKKAIEKKRQITRNANRFKQQASKFKKDPFGIKKRIKAKTNALFRRFLSKHKKAAKGVNTTLKIGRVIGKMVIAIARGVASIANFLIGISGGLFLIIALIVIAAFIIVGFLSAFDFSSYDDTIQAVIIEQLEECYQTDIETMLDLVNDYDEAEISYDYTYRDSESYEEYKNEANAEAFIQSTNSAEIIAMTLVKFDYDLEDLGTEEPSYWEKSKIRSYIKDLYYGSHEIYVTETYTQTKVDTGEVDSDGNTIYDLVTTSSATLTYRTYFFNYLFNDSYIVYGRSETPVIYLSNGSYGVYGSVSSWEALYVNLRLHGFTHEGACGIMSNLAYETAGGNGEWTDSNIESNFVDPTALNAYGYYGIVQWSESRQSNLKTWCEQNNHDYTTIEGQLAFMYYEMETSYASTYEYLTTEGNSAYDCGVYMSTYYEGYTENLEGRGTLSETFAEYFAEYADDYSALLDEVGLFSSDALDIAYIVIALQIANDDTYGYKLGGSATLNGDFDCSSFVSYCLMASGYYPNLTSKFTTATARNILSSKCGFEAYSFSIDRFNSGEIELQVGDILLYETSDGYGHMEIYVGNGYTIGAHNGKYYDPATGDQSGYEISLYSLSEDYNKYNYYLRDPDLASLIG